MRRVLRLLDFLEHLEDAFRRTGEKALVGLAEAATLEGVAAGSGSFGHGGLLSGWVGVPDRGTGGTSIVVEISSTFRPYVDRLHHAAPIRAHPTIQQTIQ